MSLIPNRKGVTTEYKRGHYYLSHTVWEDGHEEVEIHMCVPQQVAHFYDGVEVGDAMPMLHTCDAKQFDEVFSRFAALPADVPLRAIESGEISTEGASSLT